MPETERLELLEIKCAHLEHGLQELSDVLYRHQQQLDELRARNEQLSRQLESLGEQGESSPDAELPPHY